jgi:hypothetical protein
LAGALFNGAKKAASERMVAAFRRADADGARNRMMEGSNP